MSPVIGEILPAAVGARIVVDEIILVLARGIYGIFLRVLGPVRGIRNLVNEGRQELEMQKGAGDAERSAHVAQIQGERPDLVR